MWNLSRGKVETMLGDISPSPASAEGYTMATKSEYHLDHQAQVVDLGSTGHSTVVIFTLVVNALDVVVARKNNDLAAYEWIRQHTSDAV